MTDNLPPSGVTSPAATPATPSPTGGSGDSVPKQSSQPAVSPPSPQTAPKPTVPPPVPASPVVPKPTTPPGRLPSQSNIGSGMTQPPVPKSPLSPAKPAEGQPPPPPPPPKSPPPAEPSFAGEEKTKGKKSVRRILTLLSVIVIVGLVIYLGFSLLRGADLSKLPLVGSLFAPKHKDVTLTYWGLWEDADLVDPLLEDFVEHYTSEHSNVSLTINYEKRSFGTLGQYKDSLLTRLQQGTAPDIMRIHNSWVEDFSDGLSSLPDGVMSTDTYREAFYPVARYSAEIDSQIYAVPLMYDGLVLFYNEDLFAGVDVSSELSTWEGFRRQAVQLTQWEEDDPKKKILQAGAAFGAANNISHASDLLSLLFAQSQVDPLTGLGTQAAADALTFYTNFVSEDHVWDETLPYSINAFANGQVAMVFGPSWRALDIRNLNPQLNFAAVPVPQLSSAAGSGVYWASFWMETVKGDSENTEIAWELLKYLSEEQQQLKFYSDASKERYFGEPYSRPSLASELEDHEILEPLFEGAARAVSSKTTDQSGDGDYVDALKQAISDVLGGGAVDEALETAQTTIDQLEGTVTPSE